MSLPGESTDESVKLVDIHGPKHTQALHSSWMVGIITFGFALYVCIDSDVFDYVELLLVLTSFLGICGSCVLFFSPNFTSASQRAYLNTIYPLIFSVIILAVFGVYASRVVPVKNELCYTTEEFETDFCQKYVTKTLALFVAFLNGILHLIYGIVLAVIMCRKKSDNYADNFTPEFP